MKSLVRVTGSGRDVTTVKLAGTGLAVFSNGTQSTPKGIEIDSLCIEVNRQGKTINLTGENSVRDHRNTRFALLSSVIDRYIVQLANSAAGKIARNCTLQNCIFDDPLPSGAAYEGTAVTLVKFTGASQSAAHNYCGVRQCVFNAKPLSPGGSPPTVYPVLGIDPRLGRGIIAEENQFFTMEAGVNLSDSAAGAYELIFWNNEMHVVQTGFKIDSAALPAIGRIVLIENAINLVRDTSSTVSTGISIVGDQTVTTERNYSNVICRKNLIAGDPEAVGPTNPTRGIEVKNVTNALVENNLINDCPEADSVAYAYCDKFKAFNNQNTSAKLLRAYTGGSPVMELQDFVEDALIGF